MPAVTVEPPDSLRCVFIYAAIACGGVQRTAVERC